MLIDKNIKNIIGGGYNVSEVKYMDKTVWKKGTEYRFKLSPEMYADARIYVGAERLSKDYSKYINVALDYINSGVAFTHTQRGAYVKLFINENMVFDELIYGDVNGLLYDFYIDIPIKTYFLSEKNINYIKVVID